MANYTMDLKNFYWNIMISPKCRELVSMLEAYSDLQSYYSTLYSKEYRSKALEIFGKMLDIEYDIIEFIEKNIDLEHYGLEHYNKGIFGKHSLALVLIQMYEADI